VARQTEPGTFALLDRLLDDHTDAEVVEHLNRAGHVSGEGQPFHARIVMHLRRAHQLPSRAERLRAAGMLNLTEMAEHAAQEHGVVGIWLYDHLAGSVDRVTPAIGATGRTTSAEWVPSSTAATSTPTSTSGRSLLRRHLRRAELVRVGDLRSGHPGRRVGGSLITNTGADDDTADDDADAPTG
jgi:hypothetical protein